MNPQLIDRIYECAFLPDLWPGVLDELAKMADARGGWLFTANFNAGILHWTASERSRAIMERFIGSDLLSRGQRFPRLVSARHGGFLTEHDIYTDEELDADPIYRDFLRPDGLGWAAATALPLPTGDMLVIAVEREYARGPVESGIVQQLDALRPHLARGALLAARMHLERARIVSETLGQIGLPALVFNHDGVVLAANALVEGLTDHVRWRAGDRISLTDPTADGLFRQAVATLDAQSAPPTRSFGVRGAHAAAALVAHVIPIRGDARDIFAHCAGILVLTPVALPNAPPVELVQSLFDLTAAEARVARSLVAGDTVGDIAQGGGVSVNTVRAQVRGVLEKTGCRRQTEVVALLGGIAVAAR